MRHFPDRKDFSGNVKANVMVWNNRIIWSDPRAVSSLVSLGHTVLGRRYQKLGWAYVERLEMEAPCIFCREI